MSVITNIGKLPPDLIPLVEAGLSHALKRGSLGQTKIDFIQIENALSGGKTGAAVFVARYGTEDSSFIRVLKIAPKESCHSENEGYVKTRETLLDIFSQVEYFPQDEFEYIVTGEENKPVTENEKHSSTFGILLYQDVGTIAASDLKGIARYLLARILKMKLDSEEAEKLARELSLLLQKEVFLSLKKGLYGSLQRKEVNLSEYYGDKISSEKVKLQLAAMKLLDNSIPDPETLVNIFNRKATYHQVNYIHGDLNNENVLVWENERGFLSCKVIDFGEVIPKKRDNFTPLFWDFCRLLGEMILNFVEETVLKTNTEDESDKKTDDVYLEEINKILEEFWTVVEAFFQNDPSKLKAANSHIGFISRIYLSTLFDFINEAKSGIKDLRRVEVMQDYFYCQILFFLFYAKFQRENKFKRLFGVKLALKFHTYTNSNDNVLHSLIGSLEKFYFSFSGDSKKNKKPQIGPVIGAKSPFMGLSYFEEKDKDYFFGREKIIEDLVSAIEEKSVVALAGASGSGKSSVVNAGVIPRLREKKYLIYKFRPGTNPYSAATHCLGETNEFRKSIEIILNKNPDKKIFLLGDQFEELFTLCKSEREKEDIGNEILECAKDYGDRFHFFINIRSDFWTKLLESPGFSSIVSDSGENKRIGSRFFLGPMTVEELRTAIEKPLEVSGLHIQEGLTDLMLTSISKEPGSLPLLEFCLQELWNRQIDLTLNYNSYKEIGEVKGAIATYADEVFENLGKEEKDALKKIMLQLIQPGQGTEDTRRIALFDEVTGSDEFIYLLADKRLLVTGNNSDGKQTLEVVHEALIREWGRLRDWIGIDREFRVWQEKLRYAVKEWEGNGKEKELLLQGTNLIAADEWYNTRKEDLGTREIEFIQKSLEVRDILLAEEKEAEEKKKNLKKIFYVVSVAIFTLSIELSSFSFSKMKDSKWSEEKANTYVADIEYGDTGYYLENYYSLLKAGISVYQKIGDKRESVEVKEFVPKLFKGLSKYVIDLEQIRLSGKEREKTAIFLKPKFSVSKSNFAFSPDGKKFVSNDGNFNFFIRDSATGLILNTVWDKSGYALDAKFSSDGKELITVSKKLKSNNYLRSQAGYDSLMVKRWNFDTGKDFLIFDDQPYNENFTISKDGGILIAQDNTSLVYIELFKDGRKKTLNENSDVIYGNAISPDEDKFVTNYSGGKILVRDVKNFDIKNTLYAKEETEFKLAFNPYGKTLVYVDTSNVIIWETVSFKEVDKFYRTNGKIQSISISPNGKILAIGNEKAIQILDITSRNKVKELNVSGSLIESLEFSADGKVLLAKTNDSIIGYTFERSPSLFVTEFESIISQKRLSDKTTLNNLFNLLFDPNTFQYIENRRYENEEITKDDIKILLVEACNYLQPQLDNWVHQDNPPFNKREINDVSDACKNFKKNSSELE